MTAINVVKQSEYVYVITDGAAFQGGHFAGSCPKVWQMPHLHAVIAAAGPQLLAPILFQEIALSATSYDELKATILDTVRTAIDRAKPLMDRMPDPRWLIAVAGRSETTGLDAFVFHDDERIPLPWEIQTVEDIAMHPAGPDVVEGVHEIVSSREALEDFDPMTDSVRLLDLQRRNPAHGIGAFAQLTTISHWDIRTRLIHRWEQTPDFQEGERVVWAA
ncbi:hypothetical protein [Methylobacterium sp. Leaf106]|uniref:hypothetical protein n=1 Tax=Methylobacterium sp. Leaf106 TaxID=1736255 RepID=UPI0006F45939|nr:hypothetical protein [Methylobacterium sp. Leaf106]KQP53034.1 hypothetical protein ASF34_01290 [Methylobacterium sp. Leaf106]